MAPPIDYSKWEDIDSYSDIGTNPAPKADNKNTTKTNSSSHKPFKHLDIDTLTGQLKLRDLEKPDRGSASYSANNEQKFTTNPLSSTKSHSSKSLEDSHWSNAPDLKDYHKDWLTRADAIKELTALRDSTWPSQDLHDVNDFMDGLEMQFKRATKVMLESTSGVPQLQERINVNHGNHTTRKERQMVASPEFRWKLSPDPLGAQFHCIYDSILLLPIAVSGRVCRDLTLRELKAEWDAIIKRINDHLKKPLIVVVSGTKLDVLILYLKKMHQLKQEDLLRVLLAKKFVTGTHGDFCIHKDDFMILNDPKALQSSPLCIANSCHHTAMLVAMAAGPRDIAKFTAVCNMPCCTSLDPSTIGSMASAECSNLRTQITAIRDEFESVTEDILTVLFVFIADLGRDTKSYQKRNNPLNLNLSHQFVLAVGRQGVAIFQSYSLADITLGSRTMSFEEWIKNGQAEIRTWEEFDIWLDAFEIITTNASSWSSTLNNAWQKCFDVDVKKLTNSTDPDQAITGSWCPLNVISVFPHVHIHDLSKFELKLDSYRDKEGWAKVAKHMATNKYARPHESIHMWTPFV